MSVVGETANRAQLFWIGSLALFTAALSTALRAAVAVELKAAYLDPVNLANAATLIAEALGAAFLGFAIMLFITSLLLERVGMRAMLVFASLGYVAAGLLLLLCDVLGEGGVYRIIWIAMLLNGLAWGATEATINPMIAALYPDQKTHRMNMLHAYWPAGIIVGGLVGVAVAQLGFDWRYAVALVPLFGLLIGILALTQRFPQTESARMGISDTDKLLEVVRRPSFFIWFGLMFLTAASELAPGQWVDVALSSVVGMRGILLLVYVSGLMFVGRHFAGPLAHRLSAEGLLCLSSVLAALGLFLLSVASSPATALLAATIWGLGVCYMWPTMLAVAAERYPRGGAWSIGLIGVAGALSTYFVLPLLGGVYDAAQIEAAGGEAALKTLSGAQLQAAQVAAAAKSFQTAMLIPAALFAIFGVMWLLRSRRSRAAAVGEA